MEMANVRSDRRCEKHWQGSEDQLLCACGYTRGDSAVQAHHETGYGCGPVSKAEYLPCDDCRKEAAGWLLTQP